MPGQVLGYVRVSSGEQNPARQLVALRLVEETFTDTVSGKNRTDRPALTEMLRHVRRGDTLRVASERTWGRKCRRLLPLVQSASETDGPGQRR